MVIIVDELREYPDVSLPFSAWCHLATDGAFDELHEFAARLGLRRAWFQRDHYDLPAHGRAAAVALGAEEVATGELLLRMTGPRGERARRRSLAPAGVVRLRGSGGPAVLRYPRGALVVISGPPGAGKSTLAARVARGTPVLRVQLGASWEEAACRDDLCSKLASGGGAIAVTTALSHGLAKEAAAAGVPAHLLMLDADADTCRAGRAGRAAQGGQHLLAEWQAYRRTVSALSDPAPFASITLLDREAAGRLRRLHL